MIKKNCFALDAKAFQLLAAMGVTLCLALTPFRSGFAKEDSKTIAVTSNLSAWKIVQDKAGKEQVQKAESARPGDVIEYRVEYKNVGSKTATQFMANLPIPKAAVYLKDSAQPVTVLASVGDSNVFEPVPLMRVVKDKDGKEKKVPVPLEEYRTLRWLLGNLEQGKTVNVAARIKVSEGATEIALLKK